MSDQNNLEIALTKCFYCGKSNEIVLNRVLTPKSAKMVKEMDGKVLTMQPCHECEERMKQGVILLTFDPHKSDPEWYKPPDDEEKRKFWMPDPYRTGGYFVIRDEAMARWLGDENRELLADALQRRWMFIEHEAATMLGLFELEDTE